MAGVTSSSREVPVLYISYDGVLEPLGDSQVVSYLERLAATFDLSLLSFEKPADLAQPERLAAMSARLDRAHITWIRLPYHRRPAVLSTAWDVVRGIVCARRDCRKRGVRVVHARSYVPSLIALGARGVSGARFLFDMRGFWVDEKVEAGHWRAGSLLVRLGKFWERRFFEAADAIVSLTSEGVRAFSSLGYRLRPSVHIEVIPTCVDLDRFKPSPKDHTLVERLGLGGYRVIGCVGTMSNWYMRDEMLEYLALLATRWPDAKFLIVTREPHEALERDALRAGVPRDRLVLTAAAFSEMPRYTSLFDAGMFFIRPVGSKRGSAATKLAEFLACGVPVVINNGVGDSGTIVREHAVGVVLPSLDPKEMERSVAEVERAAGDSDMPRRCRAAAEALFDVNVGVARYSSLYRRLAPAGPGPGS